MSTPNSYPARRNAKPTRIVYTRHIRSVGCQVNPNDIPGFRKLAISETESQYTGVHFRENYAAVRASFIIPKIVPDLETRPNEVSSIVNLPKRKPALVYRGVVNLPAKKEVVHEVLDDGEEEEKYVGPRLHDGAIPEMIVGSGALGMTAQKKQRAFATVQRGGKRYKTVEDEDPDWTLASALKPSTSRSIRPLGTPSSRRVPKYQTAMCGSINDNLLRSIESQFSSNIEGHEESIVDDIEDDEEEQKRFRFREIGRIICELGLNDFPLDINRSSKQVANRGDEILASVRRNLSVIRDRLGEHAKGTIFDHVDELTNSFAEITPNGLARLSEGVSEKINRRREGNIADALAGISGASELLEVKQEEVDVKLEEPEYVDNYGF